VPPTYSSNSLHRDPFQQDNEIDNSVTFHFDYKWQAGSYGEVSSFISYIVEILGVSISSRCFAIDGSISNW